MDTSFLDKFSQQTKTTNLKTKDSGSKKRMRGVEVLLYEVNFSLKEYKK